jgi:hypothetical protein
VGYEYKRSSCTFSLSPKGEQSALIAHKGFFDATRRCLGKYNQYRFETTFEHSVQGARSKVDYLAVVDGEARALCDAKSPSVMKKAGELLPRRGIELKWVTGQTLLPKLLSKVSVLCCLL